MCQENVTVTSTMFILEQYCTLGYMVISQLWDLSVLLIKVKLQLVHRFATICAKYFDTIFRVKIEMWFCCIFFVGISQYKVVNISYILSPFVNQSCTQFKSGFQELSHVSGL